MRGGGNDETVSTGCGSPSVLHPWMLLLHMQETALWIHRLGLLSSRGGAQVSWMLLLHMQETVFVDSPAGPLSSRGGAQISWHQSYNVMITSPSLVNEIPLRSRVDERRTGNRETRPSKNSRKGGTSLWR